ncbi:MAG: neuraminidase-like domain-containing protein [Bacteroidia bacterium]
MPTLTVSGIVRYQNGTPITGLRVVLVERLLRNWRTLVSTTSQRQGHFSLSLAELPDVGRYYVEVLDERGATLAKEGPLSLRDGDVRLVLTVSDTRYQGEAVFSTLRPSLQPYVEELRQSQDEAVTLEDARLVSARTQVPLGEAWAWMKAHELENQAKSGQNTIPADVWYGLLKENLPASIPSLAQVPLSEIEAALERAKEANHIPASVSVRAVMKQWVRVLSEKALDEIPAGLDASFGQILELTGASRPQRLRLMELWSAHTGDSNAFWAKAGTVLRNPRLVSKVRRAIQLSAFTGFQPQMIETLLRVQIPDDVHAMAFLADMDAAAWGTMIRNAGSAGAEDRAVPTFIKGNTSRERIAAYAKGLARATERAFPEHAFFGRLDTGSGFAESKDMLRAFFSSNPDFSFRKTSARSLADGTDLNLTDIDKPGLLLKELQSVRRMQNFTDRISLIYELRKNGHDSAFSLSAMSQKGFLNTYRDFFETEAEAEETYRRAGTVRRRAYHTSTNAHSSQSIETEATVGPTIENIFGSLDACDCEHCLSMYSPAAYLTDLLHFLEKEEDVFSELKSRRPDLLKLLLNCENTETPLPYTDLAIELMEALAVSDPTQAHQTTLSAAELAAHPEHLHAPAYDLLKGAIYPWSLPFDLALEESRVYLSHLRVTRADLMTRFFKGNQEEAVKSQAIALERLGLSVAELKIITGDTQGDGSPGAGIWNFYGFNAETGYAPLTDPLDGGGLNPAGTWLEQLSERVDVFLQQTGLTYIELLQLLDCTFINPGRSKIELKNAPDAKAGTCKLDEIKLAGLEVGDLVRLHRFVRLARKLHWTFAELDQALHALQITGVEANGTAKSLTAYLTKKEVTSLAQIEHIRKDLRLTVEEVLVLWASLGSVIYTDYSGEKQQPKASLYQRRFYNKTVINPPIFPEDPQDLGALNMQIGGRKPEIMAALEIGEEDLRLLMKDLEPLNQANLSILYRKVILARSLGISIRDLLSRIAITGSDPFSTVEKTLTFLYRSDLISRLGFSAEELDYLLRHQVQPGSRLEPQDQEITTFFEEVDELRKSDDSDKALVEKIVTAFGLSIKAGILLLETYLASTEDPAERLLKDFASTDAPRRRKAYLKMSKVAKLIHDLGLTDKELTYVMANGPGLGMLDMDKLPWAPQNTADFSGFVKLAQLALARKLLKEDSDGLEKVLTLASDPASNEAGWLAALAKASGWELDTLTACDTAVAAIFPGDYQGAEMILTLAARLEMLRSTGLPVSAINAAVAAEPDAANATAVKLAVKASYPESRWNAMAKPLRDALRERQRSALVAYLVQKLPNIKDANDLYAYLLIDVETKPVVMTSRLKQAISSVQLFIDRVLMNLEHKSSDNTLLKLEPEQAEEWNTWRKVYRVWEANRKVFLYPENWIEPELRDDQSPLFEDAVSALMQNELTPETVENAFSGYVRALDEVARLEVVGIVHEQEPAVEDRPAVDIMHVIGRSHAQPHVYFHRKQEHGEWTPWLRIEGDIDGDHIVPVIFNRRLCLFWLFFTQQSEESSPIDPSAKVPKTKFYWKVQIAWCEYHQNTWSAKKLSKSYIATSKTDSNEELNARKKSGIFLRHYFGTDGTLRINLISSRLTHNPNLITMDHFVQAGFENSSDATKWCAVSFVFENTRDEPVVTPGEFIPIGHSFSLPNGLYSMANQKVIWKSGSLGLFLNFQSLTSSGAFAVSKTVPLLKSSPKGNQSMVIQAGAAQPFLRSFSFQDAQKSFWIELMSEPAYVPPLYQPELGDMPDEKYQIQLTYSQWSSTQPLTLEQGYRSSSIMYFSHISELQMVGFVDNFGELIVKVLSCEGNVYTEALSRNTGYQVPRNQAPVKGLKYQVTPFYHPQAKEFIRLLNRGGVRALLKQSTQAGAGPVDLLLPYTPTDVVKYTPMPLVDFSYGSPYSQYNWELFFHLPIHIACRLSSDQRFDEARKWFHFIFDPTTGDPGDPDSGSENRERFWQFQPFREWAKKAPQTLEDLFESENADALDEQLDKWAANPFQPHVIARMRISAYMKFTLMRYLDLLIVWGDQLFRRDTIESINEATHLYILAANILGAPPQRIPPRTQRADESFEDLADNTWTGLSNPLVQIESFIPPSAPSGGSGFGLESMPIPYFCLPRNEQLLRYWSAVADRLFKIRNSLNIEGVARSLPLFEPPIDPALLVRAAAAGIDLNTALSSSSSGLPHYRFAYMLQKVNEFVNEVKSLGAALLSAIEKRDAEAMALLRSGHEQHLLAAIRQLREQQVKEAKEQIRALQKSKESAEIRENYYSSKQLTNSQEAGQLRLADSSLRKKAMAGGFQQYAAILQFFGSFKLGGPTTVGQEVGPKDVGDASISVARFIETTASILDSQGSNILTANGYVRRKEEWDLQADLAKKDIEQIEKQLLAAEIRQAIAERELSNHRLQMEQSEETDAFMRSKFSNQQLYSWMSGQLSTLYFQTYQLAFDMAKQAEQCFDLELPHNKPTGGYIQNGYWDNLKKGLLSGDRLQYDLRRMETSYMTENRREFELTKHISLQQLNPLALLQLRVTGKCDFSIPEELFDLDFPGHYLRRIKSVSITIPCIAGPYTTVSATLRLEKSYIRKDGDKVDLSDASVPVMSNVATSSAQNDSGVFELSFRDERYLPFEGAGASGDWALEMMTDDSLRQFDYNTISDVIVHVRYTAREGGSTLRDEVQAGLKDLLNELKISSSANETGLFRLFDLRHDFPNEWNKMLKSTDTDKALTLKLEASRFPYLAQLAGPEIEALTLYTDGTKKDEAVVPPLTDDKLKMKLYELLPKRDIGEELTITFDQLPAQGYLLIRYTLNP